MSFQVYELTSADVAFKIREACGGKRIAAAKTIRDSAFKGGLGAATAAKALCYSFYIMAGFVSYAVMVRMASAFSEGSGLARAVRDDDDTSVASSAPHQLVVAREA